MTIPMVRLTKRDERGVAKFAENPGGSYEYIIYGNSVAERLAQYEDVYEKMFSVALRRYNAEKEYEKQCEEMNKIKP